MDGPVQRQLWLGMIGIPTEERLRQYESGIAADHATQGAEIHTAVDCFVRESDAGRCLGQVTGGWGASGAETRPSEALSSYSRQLGLLGERALAERWDLNRFAGEMSLSIMVTADYQGSLSVEERTAFNVLASFYARMLPDRRVEALQAQLRERADWARRLDAYERRAQTVFPVAPESSLRVPCQDEVNWETHTLPVRGISYSIPVFSPRGRTIPWAFYESALLSEFEIVKLLLTPQDLERLLRPEGSRPPLRIFIGGGFEGSNGIFNQCGLRTDDRSGEFSLEGNHMMSNESFRMMSWEWLGRNPRTAMSSQIFSVLHHEIGHAIYHNLLSEGDRQAVRRFFDAIRPLAEGDADNIPNSHIADSREPDGNRRYAMTNEAEFFAEMVDEYLYFQLNGIGPGPRPLEARRAMMGRFFGEDGLHPDAFSQDFVEEAFRETGARLRFPDSGHFDLVPSAVFSSQRGGGAELYMGFRGISGDRVLTYGGGVYVQPFFAGPGSFEMGVEGNFGAMPAAWLGLEALARIGLEMPLNASSPGGIAGVGGRLRIRPFPRSAPLFQFQGFFVPQINLGNGQWGYDTGGGLAFTFF